jgi:hypothetical protein
MLCEERDKRQKIYLDAVVQNDRAGLHFSDIHSEAWKEATTDTREDCEVALAEQDRHKAEHGC